MRQIINQQNFPRLWLLFQNLVGGNTDKKRLILKTFQGEQRVLEVGCSVGNIAEAFRSIDKVSYHGVDIDCKAIGLAQRRFSNYPNFTFVCEDLVQYSQRASAKFDLIYFAGILHHVVDQEAVRLLRGAATLLEENARLLVVEPCAVNSEDPPLMRWYANQLEQGDYLRSSAALEKIVSSIQGLMIRSSYVVPINATPFRWPLCAKFVVIEAAPQ
jgi:SAM-dependent methyltransferase